MQFSFTVTLDQRKHLAAVMTAERARIREWWRPRRKRIAKLEKPSERTVLRDKYKTQFAAACADSRFITSRTILIEPAVIAELDARGWRGPYDPLPVTALGPGRRYGSTAVVERTPMREDYTGPGTCRIGVVLSDVVGTRLVRACYYEHLDLVSQLEAFYDVYGDSPNLPDPRPGETPGTLARRHRDQLRADIETTGDILRAAVDRVIANPPQHQ